MKNYRNIKLSWVFFVVYTSSEIPSRFFIDPIFFFGIFQRNTERIIQICNSGSCDDTSTYKNIESLMVTGHLINFGLSPPPPLPNQASPS